LRNAYEEIRKQQQRQPHACEQRPFDHREESHRLKPQLIGKPQQEQQEQLEPNQPLTKFAVDGTGVRAQRPGVFHFYSFSQEAAYSRAR
jgi:hypothetical protein